MIVTGVLTPGVAPACGLVPITWPEVTVVLDWCSIRPTFRFAIWIADFAWASDSPMTGGTVAVPGPVETSSATVVFSLTLAPARGSWAITIPAGFWLVTDNWLTLRLSF